MRCVIGMDIHRTFAEVVVWEDGRLRHHGRVDMTRSGLEGFGRSLCREDEVVGNGQRHVGGSGAFAPCRPRDCREPDAGEGDRACPDQDRQDRCRGSGAVQASGFLPEVWVPDERTERRRRLVARRNQVVRHRTRVKNEVHAILQAHLAPKCPHADLFNQRGRAWLAQQMLPDDERAAIARHIREIDRLAEDPRRSRR